MASSPPPSSDPPPSRTSRASAVPPYRRLGMLATLLTDSGPLDLRLLGRMLLHAAAVGAAAGLIAAAFFGLLELGEDYFLNCLAGYTPLRAAGELAERSNTDQSFRPWLLIFLPAIGALLATALARRFAPECEGAGENAVIQAFHRKKSLMLPRVIWVKPIATLLTLASGGAGGREGPTAQIGAAIGSTVAGYLRLSERERRVLLVAGAAAGTSAIFRTPLGAALLAVEVLYRDDFESEGLVPAVLASVMGYSVFIYFYGEATLFQTAAQYPFVPSHLPYYALMALMLAVVGASYVRVMRLVERLSAKLPAWCRSAVGGLGVGLMATVIVMATVPGMGLGILGGGYGAAQVAIIGSSWLPDGYSGVQLLLLLGVAKLLASSLTIGTGGCAGVFGPSLAIGALFGGAFGRFIQVAFDNPSIEPGAFALVGMGAFFGGLGHAPLGALVMVCEMAGSYDLLVPLMLAEAISFVALRRRTLYPAQVPTKHESPAHPGRKLKVLKKIKVTDVVVRDREYESFTPDTRVPDIMKAVADTSWQDVFPVLDQRGKMVGMVTPELLRLLAADRDLEDWAVAADTMQPPVTIALDDNLRHVSQTMVAHNLRELPVIDEQSRIVGFLDESEIAQTYLQTTGDNHDGSKPTPDE